MSEPATTPHPEGDLVMRTLAMPADTNANGDIFGGWIVSQMDLGGCIIAKRYAQNRVVTVAIEGMSFLNPVQVGDIISCYAKLLKVGRTSMRIAVETWVERHLAATWFKVTEGVFTYVAIDEHRRPVPVNAYRPPEKSS